MIMTYSFPAILSNGNFLTMEAVKDILTCDFLLATFDVSHETYDLWHWNVFWCKSEAMTR